MSVIAIVCALIAAFLNACSSVLQRMAIGAPKLSQLSRRNFVANILKNKRWLAGLLLQVVAFLFQATAYYFGALILVAPLLLGDLVFLMLILQFTGKLKAGWREWISVALICLGLAGLLVVANPRSGAMPPSTAAVFVSLGIGVLLIAGISFLLHHLSSSKIRAALAGLAAGFSFALVAIFTKLSGHQLAEGIGPLFTSWPLYFLIVAGIGSTFLQQQAYAVGPLATSQPAMEITELFSNMLIGIIVFSEIVTVSPAAVAGQIVGGVAACCGVVILTGSKRIYENQTDQPKAKRKHEPARS